MQAINHDSISLWYQDTPDILTQMFLQSMLMPQGYFETKLLLAPLLGFYYWLIVAFAF